MGVGEPTGVCSRRECKFSSESSSRNLPFPMDFYGNAPPPSSNSSHLEYFPVDDLLDFSNDAVFAPTFYSADHSSNLLPPSLPALYDQTSSSNFHSYPYSLEFNYQLSVPIDEMEELEWLSQFMDDSCADVPAAGGGAAAAMRSLESGSKPRSKRPKEAMGEQEVRPAGARRCTHCASEKTPQWRTGPLGPKTLCNACGVRFKSGRLVPEYRPASSPTFVLTQHSNSHRKVLELRRQKELLRQQSQSLGRC